MTMLDVRKAEDRAEWAIPGSLHVDAYEALKAGDPDALANAAIRYRRCRSSRSAVPGRSASPPMEQLRTRGYDARSLRRRHEGVESGLE